MGSERLRVAFLRRKPHHLVRLDEPVTLCGYRIPTMARWRIRAPGVRPGTWVTCQECKTEAAR
jgi:hypothetical protein